MKWYGIIAFLVLIGGLAGIVIIGMSGEKLGPGFGEPSFISKQTPSITNSQPTNTQPNYASKQICDQWQQELINVRVMKSLTDPRYLDYPEFQSLMLKEFELDQKLKFRCK